LRLAINLDPVVAHVSIDLGLVQLGDDQVGILDGHVAFDAVFGYGLNVVSALFTESGTCLALRSLKTVAMGQPRLDRYRCFRFDDADDGANTIHFG
jgi:hypothetical protein